MTKKQKGTAVVASALLPHSYLSSSFVDALDNQYLEPVVQRHAQVLSPDVCKQLINLGEESGFLVVKESIDATEQNDPNEKFIPSQTIDVYSKGWSEPEFLDPENGHVVNIDNERIWNLLQPVIPKITDIVKVNRHKAAFAEYYPDEPDREPALNWVFFRKYSPDDERNSLKHHMDTNMNTVNIELSDDYTGGGLFYIKPSASTGLIPDEYYEGGYNWIDSLKRENTSDIIFPDLHAGDAIFYNYTVRHGVAPVESGVRYSMAFFFDMDNPAVQLDTDDELEDEDGVDNAAEWDGFNHVSGDTIEDLNTFKIKFHNGLSDVDLDLVLVYDAAHGKDVWERLLDDVIPNETTIYHAYEGDLLWALVAGTDEVVSEIEIRRDRSLYNVSEMTTILSSEL